MKRSQALKNRALNELDCLRDIVGRMDAKMLAEVYAGGVTNTLRSLIRQMIKAIREEGTGEPMLEYYNGQMEAGLYFSWWPPRLEKRHVFCVARGRHAYVNRITNEGYLAGTYWLCQSDYNLKIQTGEIKPVEYVLEGDFSEEDIKRISPLVPYLQVPEDRYIGREMLRKLAVRARAEARKAKSIA